MADDALTHFVITSTDDGRDHLVCQRDALAVVAERGRDGFPACCGHSVRPETDLARMGAWLCQPCVRRLPEGAHIRACLGDRWVSYPYRGALVAKPCS